MALQNMYQNSKGQDPEIASSVRNAPPGISLC